MPVRKIVIAAVLGGLAMFIWGAISHMTLPLYNSALQKFANEDAVTQAIIANAPVSGTYFLPNLPTLLAGASEEQKRAADKAMEERSEKGPQMFAFIRVGPFGSFGTHLLGEFLSDVVAVLLVSWLFLRLGLSSMRNRLTAAIAIGFTIILSETMSQWIWYSSGFAFTLAETVDQVIGWLAAGFVIAKVLPRAEQKMA